MQLLVTFKMRTWSKVYMMRGLNGKGINTHTSASPTFIHKGTNGFTSKRDVEST